MELWQPETLKVGTENKKPHFTTANKLVILIIIMTVGAAMTPENIRKYGELPQQFLTSEEIVERAEWRQLGIAAPRQRGRGRGRGSRGGRARGRGQGGQNRHGGYMDQSSSHSRSLSPAPSDSQQRDGGAGADGLVAPRYFLSYLALLQ